MPAHGVALHTQVALVPEPIVLQYGVPDAHVPAHVGGPWYDPHAGANETQPQRPPPMSPQTEPWAGQGPLHSGKAAPPHVAEIVVVVVAPGWVVVVVTVPSIAGAQRKL